MTRMTDVHEAAADVGLFAPVYAGTSAHAGTTDEAWIQAMLDAEAGLVRAQADVGLVPRAAAETITDAARADLLDLAALAVASRGAANPVVALVRAFSELVAAADPGAAEYVHRGSTSQDILDTASMLVASRVLAIVQTDLERIVQALARLAEEHRATPIPGRTLTQHAVPTTFGLKAAGWLQIVLDAGDRVRLIRDGGLPVQLGGAAGTLAGYVEYARRDGNPCGADGGYVNDLMSAFAQQVGLAEPVVPWHTLRTPVADLGHTLSLLTGSLGKIAVDVQSMARTEVSEVYEPAAEGRGASSAMPHKRNPVLATMIRAAAMQVPLLAAGLALSMLAEDERPAGAWHAEWQPLRECLRLAGGAAHTAVELVEGLVVSPERMRENLAITGSLVVSERLSIALAPGVGKLAAKDLVSRASASAAASGRSLADAILDDPAVSGYVTPEEIAQLLDPEQYLGAASQLVDRVLHNYRTSRES